MEKDNFSAEQDISSQPAEIVEYPEFNPDEAERLKNTEKVKMVFWEQKQNFLKNIETGIANGDLPEQLKERENELWTMNVEVKDPEYFSQEGSGRADHLTNYMLNLDNGQVRRRHEISLPIDILENPERAHMINHELAHGLEGYRDENSQGLRRLFDGENNHLGMCMNEGMTEYMAEKVSGEKINYSANDEEFISGKKNIYEKDRDGKIPGYPRYYKFIKFLSSAGKTEVDMKYFIDAYCLNGEEGDKAIVTLRDKLAEAFPTENGVNPLDNLAVHNKDQIEYWITTYTQNID